MAKGKPGDVYTTDLPNAAVSFDVARAVRETDLASIAATSVSPSAPIRVPAGAAASEDWEELDEEKAAAHGVS